MKDNEGKTQHYIKLKHGSSIIVSDQCGPHLFCSHIQANLTINFENRKQMENLSRALLDIANYCFPIDQAETVFESMISEGAIHEKGESE